MRGEDRGARMKEKVARKEDIKESREEERERKGERIEETRGRREER